MRSCVGVRATTTLAALFVLVLIALPAAQDSSPAAPLTLVSREGRRPLPTTVQSGRELVALDDIASLFQVSVKEDTLAGGITVSYRGRTIVASANRPMASVEGRIVTLPSPVVRSGRRWLVPVEFIPVALASIYGQRIELRRASRLLVVGDVRLPRVSGYIDDAAPTTRAAIEISPAAPVVVAAEPGRLVIRIEADGLDLGLPPAGGGLIERIRPGEQPNSVIVSLAPGAGAGRATVATANNVARVLIEVPPAAPPESRAPSPEPGLLTGVSRAWQTIVIDPGHGGDDVGVRGPNGLEEKRLTLDIARRLRTMIEQRLGLRVVLTRDDDRALGLDERAAVANNGKADLLLSLHANGSPVPAKAGAEVFHLALDRESAEVVRAATVEGVTLPALGGRLRRLDLIPWDLAQARHLDESAVLAGVIREELQRQQIPLSEQPIRQAPMRLLAAANMPAALVEIGYLTNPQQEGRLNNDDFKTAVAQAMFSALVRFRAWSEDTRTP